MDYFFAACEELRHPELKGKPTIVGADPKEGQGRGVVMTCNYEARKFGIHSAMPIAAAYRLRPDANYVLMDYPYYEKKSNEVIELLKSHTDRIEQVSIDEAFVDISDKVKDYDEALGYARMIKEEITAKVGLPCTIGAGPNKLLAKMVCESAKPNGVKLVRAEDAKSFLSKLPVGKLYGIGEKTSQKLQTLGIKTVEELAKANRMVLMEQFGRMGIELYNNANGIDEGKVVPSGPAKSIGKEKTLEHDTEDEQLVIAAINELAERVVNEAKASNFSFKTITLKLRYSDFSEHLKSRSVKPSNDVAVVKETAVQLYRRYADKGKKLRKLGVRLSGLQQSKSQRSISSFFS